MSLRFIHISDSHIDLVSQENATVLLPITTGSNSKALNIFSPGFTRVTEKIKNLVSEGLALDFIIHTGDVCNSDDLSGATQTTAQLASELLGQCGVINNISERTTGSFWVEHQGTTLLFLDARPRYALTSSVDSESQASTNVTLQVESFEWDGRHPHDPEGYLDPEELDIVDKLIDDAPGQVAIFTHYPPLGLDCPWVDTSMCIKNGCLLHEILKIYQKKISGVFFGHVHHSQQRLHDGVLYVATGAIAHQFDTSSHLSEARVSESNMHHLNYVHINEGGTFVKQYSLTSV